MRKITVIIEDGFNTLSQTIKCDAICFAASGVGALSSHLNHEMNMLIESQKDWIAEEPKDCKFVIACRYSDVIACGIDTSFDALCVYIGEHFNNVCKRNPSYSDKYTKEEHKKFWYHLLEVNESECENLMRDHIDNAHENKWFHYSA